MSISVFLDFFGFIAFFWCFSAMGVQKHHKKRFTKQIVSKSFSKKSTKKSKTDFSRFVLLSFWAFLGEGSSKTRLKNLEKIWPALVLFWPPRNQPTT
jgi:hypothetical protein